MLLDLDFYVFVMSFVFLMVNRTTLTWIYIYIYIYNNLKIFICLPFKKNLGTPSVFFYANKIKSNTPQISFSIFSIPLTILFGLISLRMFLWKWRMFLSQNFIILRNILLDLDFYVFVMCFVFITVKVKRWVTKA